MGSVGLPSKSSWINLGRLGEKEALGVVGSLFPVVGKVVWSICGSWTKGVWVGVTGNPAPGEKIGMLKPELVHL